MWQQNPQPKINQSAWADVGLCLVVRACYLQPSSPHHTCSVCCEAPSASFSYCLALKVFDFEIFVTSVQDRWIWSEWLWPALRESYDRKERMTVMKGVASISLRRGLFSESGRVSGTVEQLPEKFLKENNSVISSDLERLWQPDQLPLLGSHSFSLIFKFQILSSILTSPSTFPE